MAIINMQTMRYINLLERVARVRATKCFVYNNMIYFAVPPNSFSRARGSDNQNAKILSEQLGKRIRIVRDANDDLHSVSQFIEDVVSPATFASLEFHNGVYLLTAGSRERAATLIGRNKTRLTELNLIVESYFGKTIKIV
ncbi:hypothetical protein J4416_03060 [Candidatus Pacearchaeota archaeon]|nr:hypothetical protein [Candidatus Pacearchaeota archaeon]